MHIYAQVIQRILVGDLDSLIGDSVATTSFAY